MIGVLFDLLQVSWLFDLALQHELCLNKRKKYLL